MWLTYVSVLQSHNLFFMTVSVILHKAIKRVEYNGGTKWPLFYDLTIGTNKSFVHVYVAVAVQYVF